MKTKGWVGLGLSPNGGMKGSDIFLGWVKDGQVELTVSIGKLFTIHTQVCTFFLFKFTCSALCEIQLLKGANVIIVVIWVKIF